MKFLITGDIHSKKGLFWGVLFFVLLSIFFWASGFFNFYLKYGFSYESLFKYYFTDPEFPEPISLQQLSEDFHINTFLFSFFFLMVSSLFSITEINGKIKMITVILFGVATTLYCLSDFFVFLSSDLVIYSKLFSFGMLQIFSGYMLLLTLVFLIKRRTNGKRLNLQKLNIYLSTFLLFIFFISSVLVFYAKYGFSVQGIKEYFLGNPEQFKRPKTFAGLFKSFYPHILSMALYSFTLLHFSLFKELNKNFLVFVGVLLFVALFFENLSSVLILIFGCSFIYVKLVMFFIFTILSLIFFIAVFSLKR